ncbi:hypothetical protein [Gymnodinialimonas hymeniacidonis]|uniref:hypothetical protein n=1 Tax=Gymnodinialimonas hymeniacidonis TaxID=3126508 RepID=UPI0034C6CAA5
MGETRGWNGYGDWTLELAGLNEKACKDLNSYWEPIFLRVLTHKGEPAFHEQSDEFFKYAEAIGREGGFWVPPMEKQFHDAIKSPRATVELIAYRRLDLREKLNGKEKGLLFETLAVGTCLHDDTLPTLNRVEPRDPFLPPKLVFGIIDDGIGVLHGRSRRYPTASRIEKVLWLSGSMGAASVQTISQIDAELSRPIQRAEQDAYHEYAQAAYAPLTRHSLGRAQTHGAHMLDLAVGANAGDPLTKVPILAVQVAPESFDDTSGTRLNFDILIGLRWLILETALLAGLGTPVDLVVNMSLGYVAGPKNGRSFIEQAIARLMEVAEHALHMNVHLVVPFGNAYSDNVVARSKIEAGGAQDFNLRVQPDDRTPSFLEMRLTDQSPAQDPGQIEVTVTAPRGGLQANVFTLNAGQFADLNDDAGRLVGRLYHIPARLLFAGQVEPAYLLFALAPTVRSRSDAELTCPSGQWRLSLRNLGKQAMDLTAQVQRDDDPSDRNTGARQARLEGEETRTWDLVGRDFEGVDETAGRVTRKGTNSALSTIQHSRRLSVGGALVRRDPAVPAHLLVEPAEYYGAEGADWSGLAPDLSAISEVERNAPGVTAAGLTTAGNARLSGSSTACATASRDLVNQLLGVAHLPDVPHPVSDPRLGQRTLLDTPAIRRRP